MGRASSSDRSTLPATRWLIWCLRMAWRDTRGSRLHLILSMLTMAVGISALVAIQGFGQRLDATLQQQTRVLLGADFSIRSRQPWSSAADDFLMTLPGEQVRETRFASMAVADTSGDTQLSQIRAFTGPFPFYGELQGYPQETIYAFLDNPDKALVEETLLIQLGLEIGDRLRIGARTFTVSGVLQDISGELPTTASLTGPRIFISAAALADTELLSDESLARYLAHFQLPSDISATALQQQHRQQLAELRLQMGTAEQRTDVLGRILNQVYLYLTMGALTAVILGGIGCAGSIQLYARRKRAIAATLRCLGTPALPTFAIYLIQALATAIFGGIAGALAGSALQEMIPWILAGFLPFEIAPAQPFRLWAWGVTVGITVSFVFTAWPLLRLRGVSPLEAIRPESLPVAKPGESGTSLIRQKMIRLLSSFAQSDPLQWAMGSLLWMALLAFCIVQSGSWQQGLILTVAISIIFIFLAASAKMMMHIARRLFSRIGSFTWRQGIANIHRPFNQTTLLLLSLGLGSFLLSTLSLTQISFVRQFQGGSDTGEPNLIFFNVQPDQREGTLELLQNHDVVVDEVTPIVTKRLEAVNDVPIAQLRDDPDRDIPHWVLFREYRSTHRAQLLERDQIIRGRWEPYNGSGPIPISIAADLGRHLDIGLNDRLTFNLQGVRLECVVRSIREVDWREMRTNFFVIFPSGILEDAPHSFALVTAVPSAEVAAQAQRAVAQAFPNVSAIDLRSIVSSINEIIDQATFVIRFMALFSVLTGLLVLGVTVVATRFDRAEESGLLRTLGASRSQLRCIMAAEYIVLGGTAAINGVALGVLASWAACRWMLNVPFQPSGAVIIVFPVSIAMLTVLVGFALTHWTSRLR